MIQLHASLYVRYGLHQHWAKIEVPSDPAAIAQLQERLAKRFPVDLFNALRRILDPKGVMSNNIINALFGEVNNK